VGGRTGAVTLCETVGWSRTELGLAKSNPIHLSPPPL
jgi:hypothetical protein